MASFNLNEIIDGAKLAVEALTALVAVIMSALKTIGAAHAEGRTITDEEKDAQRAKTRDAIAKAKAAVAAIETKVG